MYISKIRIQNFRCFEDVTVELYEGLNVFIGENNSGKTTVLKALQLIFDNSFPKKLSIDDFHKGISSFEEPPQISITVTIQGTTDEKTEDKALVATWLTKLSFPWEATLTYIYFLPEGDSIDYKEALYRRDKSLTGEWEILEEFLPKYISRIYAGNFASKNRVESECLEKFDCKFLDALRDVENSIYNGRNSLFKQVMNHFLDYDSRTKIKTLEQNCELVASQNELEFCLKTLDCRKSDFKEKSKYLVKSVERRLDTDNVLRFLENTGAYVCGKPVIEGKLSESDIISILKLLIENNCGLQIPVSNNGLGYNNLIYISLVLSNLEIITSSEFGENAKIFPILLIEEPEAHLHPALQYNFLRFLKEEVENHKISRQIFITTHSTHITAAVGLDSIICMESYKDQIYARYPGRVFSSESKDDIVSKKYIERYLDATKSNMLFSKGVIFVEGLAEQLLIPCFAEYADFPLDKKHVAVIGVGGSTFKHFIKLFGGGIDENNKNYALSKRVSCIVDVDPKKKKKESGAKWKSCWPFEINLDLHSYQYMPISGVITNLKTALESSNNDNVKIFYNKSIKSRTLEYDLALENEYSLLLVEHIDRDAISIPPDLNNILESSDWEDEDISKAKFAVYYLESVKDSKGSVAFDLASRLFDNLKARSPLEVKLPPHIKEAIIWACSGRLENGSR